jgi:hypothetical protein
LCSERSSGDISDIGTGIESFVLVGIEVRDIFDLNGRINGLAGSFKIEAWETVADVSGLDFCLGFGELRCPAAAGDWIITDRY